MPWWTWMILGLLLAIAEAHIPTNFFLLAFGIGGFVVGALTGLGWLGEPWTEWLSFTLVSIAAVVVAQRTISRTEPTHRIDDLRNEPAVVIEEIPPGGVGRAELRGSTWGARGIDGTAIARGTRCRVERVDGLTLWLQPE